MEKKTNFLNILFIILLFNCYLFNSQKTKTNLNFKQIELSKSNDFSTINNTIKLIQFENSISSKHQQVEELKRDFIHQNRIFIQKELELFNKPRPLKIDNNRSLKLNDFALISLTQDNKSWIWRFFSTFMIVMISSTLTFLIVKSSVDWAGSSRIELNKMRDDELSRITEEINQKYQINKGNVD